jgi:hypothetical protein
MSSRKEGEIISRTVVVKSSTRLRASGIVGSFVAEMRNRVRQAEKENH